MSGIAFYFEAVRAGGGQWVELHVYNGLPESAKHPLGALNFTVAEWEAFRPALIGMMRWAGYARLPMALKDQTRVKDKKAEKGLRIVH